MSTTNRITCPDCGVEMNHHADKLDYGTAPGDPADAEAGGVIIEAHTCPGCGRAETRPSRAGIDIGG